MATQHDTSTLTNTDNLQVHTSQVVIVCTEWNQTIVGELVAGAKLILDSYPQVNLDIVKVPGCVEIPFAIAQHYKHLQADAYIAFGCVVRGETPHFDFVCQAVTDGISTLNTSIDSPCIFGVLTVNTEEQAHERIGGIHGHKGKEAAIAALKMMAIREGFKSQTK